MEPITSSSTSSAESPSTATNFDFVCPICLQTKFQLQKLPVSYRGLSCSCCQRTFDTDSNYVDLTLTSGVQQRVYEQKGWTGQELFRQPLVSWVYERGWRQGFAWAGFPGVDKEFDLAMGFLRGQEGEVLLDMSCGSGLFTRLFARSGKFSGVIAADFSESMLTQTKAFIEQDPSTSKTPLVLLRADIGRLPFASGSLAAIHAGAALHCWPNPQLAFAEISRVLKPGGVFVASTFLSATAPLGQVLGDDNVRPLAKLLPDPSNNRTYKWWEEQELRDLAASVGLQNFTAHRSNRFIMLQVTKPSA